MIAVVMGACNNLCGIRLPRVLVSPYINAVSLNEQEKRPSLTEVKEGLVFGKIRKAVAY